jgi:cytochrome c oxidase subunit 2
VRSNRRLRWAAIPVAAALAFVLAGCSQEQLQGYLPTEPGTTNHVDRIMGLWVTSWIVLLVVGVITWGLIVWAALVYRRRRGQTGLPVQLRYNMPIEILYTIVPLILVLGFFAFTARDQAAIEQADPDPDVHIQVYGKRWSWDFNYVDENVYTQGTQARQEGPDNQIDTSTLPTLYLPVGKSVRIDVNSRDVQHSFWIVEFLYKKDLYPGLDNSIYFTPEKVGDYNGKCAELCGEYHSLMLFKVKVVEQAEYDAHIAELRAAGNEGQVSGDYDTRYYNTQEDASAEASVDGESGN